MPHLDYLMRHGPATKYLAKALTQGTITCVLGAGASAGYGLPNWPVLINRMRTDSNVGLAPVKVDPRPSAEALQVAADEVRAGLPDPTKFGELIKKHLYADVLHLNEEALRDPLLIALGSLMMGARRGTVKKVLTFNFDSLLEWYLSLHGFSPRVVTELPSLEGSEDVRIYHPHGFLPHPDLRLRDSEEILLGLEAIDRRLAEAGNPWYELLRHVLRTSVCIFIGLSLGSFRDRAIGPALMKIGEELAPARPSGFWLLCDDIDDDAQKSSAIKEFTRRNVVPILCKPADIPKFLHAICRHAAEGVIAI